MLAHVTLPSTLTAHFLPVTTENQLLRRGAGPDDDAALRQLRRVINSAFELQIIRGGDDDPLRLAELSRAQGRSVEPAEPERHVDVVNEKIVALVREL